MIATSAQRQRRTSASPTHLLDDARKAFAFAGFLDRLRIYGAGDRFRTDDLVLGKHALYQLSYTRSPNR
jgi:hypothetical protein